LDKNNETAPSALYRMGPGGAWAAWRGTATGFRRNSCFIVGFSRCVFAPGTCRDKCEVERGQQKAECTHATVSSVSNKNSQQFVVINFGNAKQANGCITFQPHIRMVTAIPIPTRMSQLPYFIIFIVFHLGYTF